MASSSIHESADWETGNDLIIVSDAASATARETVQPPAASLLGHELKTLARESSHYLAGLIGNLALGFVSFPIFTRVLSVSEYGIMDLGQRLLLMLTIASKLGFQNASLRFYNRQEFAKSVTSERSYYSTLFFGMLANSVTVGLLFLLAAGLLPTASILGSLANLVYLILGLSLLRAMGSVLWGFMRIEERTKTFNILQVTTKATTLAIVFALLAWIGPYARAYFVGALGVEAVLVVALTLWLISRRVLIPRCFNISFFRAAFAFGAPLVLYEFAFAVLGSADRFLVRHYVGANALGLYSVAYGLAANVNEFLIAPLTLALVPIYLRIWTSDGPQKTSAFLTLAFDLFILTAAGVLAAVATAGHSALVLLASSKYSRADSLIPVILCGLLIWTANIFVGAGLFIHKQTVKMAGFLVFAAIANILLNCLLLPRMGIMGGAIATLLSYLVFIVSVAWASGRLLPLHVDLQSCAKYAVAALIAWMVGSQLRIDTAALSFMAKSAVVLTVYVSVLYALSNRVRSAINWAFTWIRARC
jgi:O-antigen/teichoic acid export membrane protein